MVPYCIFVIYAAHIESIYKPIRMPGRALTFLWEVKNVRKKNGLDSFTVMDIWYHRSQYHFNELWGLSERFFFLWTFVQFTVTFSATKKNCVRVVRLASAVFNERLS